MIFEPRASAVIYNLLNSYEGDKVFLVPANVCPIVLVTFLKAKKRFELIDISNQTLCMDEEDALRKLGNNPSKYAGVFFVRTFGVLGSFEHFYEEIKKINEDFLIVDDQCLSAPDPELSKDTIADVVLYSTGYAKIVDLSYGGLAQLKPNIRYNKNTLSFDEQSHDRIINEYKNSIANNSMFLYKDCDWLDNTHVGISLEHYLSSIEEAYKTSIETKNIINKIYSENLPQSIQLDSKYQLWRFNIRTSKKDEILDALFKNKLFASSHYASLKGIFSLGKAPNAEDLHANVINLFNDRNYDEERAYRTVEIINKFL
ncbi:hypothetical protein [Paenibacillus aquistagni]|uniref:dTDP-4-amino-4,6-dideoxygalactose transaminase n=1 Tax=Paenibacillus aquistagni TaxID=1852522 RepID=A0A1X7KYM5_9BACL|nr:hypothetical protein [Paenibacillus aquistagni]SMG46671.1 hypothetical protein SAMN06295960_2864 [Paenibacillus aquistagni]